MDASAFSDQIPAMIHDQLDFACRAVQDSRRQIMMAQRGHRDGLGVDGIRLAELSATTAGAGHQPRRNPHHPVPGTQQIALQAARQMPTILQGKRHLRPLRGPLDQQQMAFAGRRHRLLTKATSDVIDHDQCVGAFVRIRANHDHAELPCSRQQVVLHRAARARLNRAQAGSYQATSLLRAGPAGPHIAGKATSQNWGSEETSEPHRT